MAEKTFYGIFARQRGDDSVACFAFYAPVKDVLRWAGIRRTAETPQGTQRVLRPPRAKAITRFLGADKMNVIPNSVLVCFGPGVARFTPLVLNGIEGQEAANNGCGDRLQMGSISFEYVENAPEHERPALIVDGQHRLAGMQAYAEADLPVLIVAMLDADVQEQAFQFIVINNKAVRVPTDNVKAIIAEIDEVRLSTRLRSAGVRYGEISPILYELNLLESSPFKGLLDWDVNRDGRRIVPLTAVEQALRYMRAEFTMLDEDEDSLLDIFCAVWRGIKAAFPELWGEDNKLMKKVCLNAINEFVVHRIKIAWSMNLFDIFEPGVVEEQSLRISEPLVKDFWESDWPGVQIQDNANMRAMIKRDLEQIVENTKLRRPWNHDVALVAVEVSEEGE